MPRDVGSIYVTNDIDRDISVAALQPVLIPFRLLLLKHTLSQRRIRDRIFRADHKFLSPVKLRHCLLFTSFENVEVF